MSLALNSGDQTPKTNQYDIIQDICIVGPSLSSPDGEINEDNLLLDKMSTNSTFCNGLLPFMVPKVSPIKSVSYLNQAEFFRKPIVKSIKERYTVMLNGDIRKYICVVKIECPLKLGYNTYKYYLIVSHYPFCDLFDIILPQFLIHLQEEFSRHFEEIDDETYLGIVIRYFDIYMSKLSEAKCQFILNSINVLQNSDRFVVNYQQYTFTYEGHPHFLKPKNFKFYRDIFRIWSFGDFLLLVGELILESQIFLYSKDRSILTRAIFTLIVFIYPIEYCGALMSCLDKSSEDRMESVGITLYGISHLPAHFNEDTLLYDFEQRKLIYINWKSPKIPMPNYDKIVTELGPLYDAIKADIDNDRVCNQFCDNFEGYIMRLIGMVHIYNNNTKDKDKSKTHTNIGDLSIAISDEHLSQSDYMFVQKMSESQSFTNDKFLDKD